MPDQPAQPATTFSKTVVRAKNLLVLTFEFVNLQLDTSANQPRLTRADAKLAAYIIVQFPPQNIAERAYFEVAPSYPVPPPDPDTNTGNETPQSPAESILAGSSQLVFEVPDTITDIPYTLDALLNWTAYTMRVAPVALPPIPPYPDPSTRPLITDPNDPSIAPVTAIEAPYRLIISPNALDTWVNADGEVTHDKRTELWHTRLAIWNPTTKQYDEQDNANLAIRAIWSPDWSATNPPQGHTVVQPRLSLDARDRYEIVELTSDFTIKELLILPKAAETANAEPTHIPVENVSPETMEPAAQLPPVEGIPTPVHLPMPIPAPIPIPIPYVYYNPLPAQVNRLMLSSQGAWLDVEGRWTPPTSTDLSVEEWDHRAAMGRDNYVQVVYQGYLFPFGHRASLIKVTERKFYADPNNPSGPITAYLFQRMYIVVREPEKHYVNQQLNINVYQVAFQSDSTVSARGITGQGREMPLTMVRITTRVTPDLAQPMFIGSSSSFWPQVKGSDGSIVDFKFHLVGVDAEGQQCEFTAGLIFVSDEDRSHGDRIAAIQANYAQDNTRRACSVPGQSIAFANSARAKPGASTLATNILYFDSKLPAQVSPGDLPFLPWLYQADVRIPAVDQLIASSSAPASNLIALYENYLSSDFDQNAQVFAQHLNPPLLAFPADKSGGLVTPNLNISGLSQILGPVAGSLSDMAGGKFDPTQFFDASAKILGGITLQDIIQEITGGGPDFTGGSVPQLTTSRSGTTVTTTLTWQPGLQPTPQNDPVFVPHDSKGLNITAQIIASLTNPNDVTFSINGVLKNFDISFADVIDVSFSSLTFSSQKGQKMSVNAAVSGVQFIGKLSFVQELQNYIPQTGFINGLTISVTPAGLDASYTLGLPPFAVGIFSLENLALGADLKLPFLPPDPASLSFNFATRVHPFHLVVSLLGGGGFFDIAVGLDGIQSMEAALEFGGEVSIDLGVASGSISIMAGIYFSMDHSNTITLTGYFRADGSLSVLGLITISAEFYLGLSYVSPSDVAGQATLTVEVDIAFFSQSVSLTVEKRFHGGGSSGGAMHALEMMMAPMEMGGGIGGSPHALPAASPPPAYTIPTFGDLETSADWAEYCGAFV